jgi:hypothetical protein
MPSGNTGFQQLQLGQNVISFTGTAAPATGYHQAGEIAYVNPPTAGYPLFFTCITTGTPGTWVAGPPAVSATQTAITAAAAVPAGASFVAFSPGGYAATMAPATGTPINYQLNMYASAAVTLSAVSGESITGSNTIAAGVVAQFVHGSPTVWFRLG